jgi:hypothetical protein
LKLHPAIIASKVKKHKVIFDDADRLVMLFRMNKALKRTIELIERWSSKNCYAHVIPSKDRYNYHSSKFHEIRNFPSIDVVKKSKSIKLDNIVYKFLKGKVVIYVNGWISDTRGAKFIKNLIACISRGYLEDKVAILIAGKIDTKILNDAIKSKCCYNFGKISLEESLRLYSLSDYALTLYDPVIEINRFAESNKWGDCIMYLVIPVVNSFIESADFLGKGMLLVDYNDCSILINDIRKLIKNPAHNDEKKRKLRELQKKIIPFDKGVLILIRFQVETNNPWPSSQAS